MDRQLPKLLCGPMLMLVGLAITALVTRPLLPVDETRYVGVAWEMWHSGDYLVMFKNGEPYSHKPPLLFWIYNLGWAVFGVHDWWPRSVSLLFSLGSLLLTASIAQRLWPQSVNGLRNAVWILASSGLWMTFATTIMFDVMLAFVVLLGIRGLLIAADESLKRGFAWLSLAIGLGVLAKGPVVLLHLLPVALLAFWWRPGVIGWRWYGGIVLAVAVGASIALAWAIPAAIHGGPEYRDAIFWGQTANRMVESFAHKRPLWWYVPILPLLFFPWLVWPELWRRLIGMKHSALDRGWRFCLAWLLPVFVAFSFISGKQVHYLLPLFPAFALMAGQALSTTERATFRLPVLCFCLIGLAMVYFAVEGLPGKAKDWEALPWWPGIVLILGALIAGKRCKFWLPSLSLLTGAGFFLLQIYLSQNAWARYNVGPIADAIKHLQDQGVAVSHVGRYHNQFQYAGRLQEPLTELARSAVPRWLAEHPQSVLVTYVDPPVYQAGRAHEHLFSAPFRGKIALLLNAQQAKAWPEAWQNVREDGPGDGD